MTLPKFRNWELVVLGLILFIGGFLRLYRLPETVMFRGDQGRDAIVVKRIIKDQDIALIGPVTSVGNMYLGPFYYYFMAPFLALSYPSPLGPAYGVALTNIVTLLVLYVVSKKYFGTSIALLATFLLAIFPPAVQYSRFSWNPNIAPLFSLLLFFTLLRWWESRKISWAVLVGVMMGILAQLHYVSLIVGGVVGLVMIGNMLLRKEYKTTIFHGLTAVLAFVTTQIPLIVFDFRHNHIISQKFFEFLTSDEKHIRSISLLTQVQHIVDRISFVLVELFGQTVTLHGLSQMVALLLLGMFGYLGFRAIKKDHDHIALLLTVIWLLLTAVGIAFYSHSVFIHYLTFSYPLITIFWAIVIMYLWQQRYTKPLSIVVLMAIAFVSYKSLTSLSWDGLGTSMLRQTVSETLPHVEAPYNIVLLSDDRDYKGMSYRYFFETSENRPLEPEDYGSLTTLALIDEVNTQDPLSVPIYEIKSADGFKLTNRIKIENGPLVLILKKE